MKISKPVVGEKEIRALGNVELRAGGAGEAKKIGGYAAVFNTPTDIGGYFREKIAPGCFADSIAKDDIRALFNHNSDYVLGRNTNKTLTLSEDATGLAFEVTPPDTSWARDVVSSVGRADINGMSFGFRVQREEWDDTGELPVRTLLQAEIMEASVCTFPAYPDTSCALRSLEWVRAQKKQAEEAAAAEATKRAAEKTAADAAAAEADRIAKIGAAPVIGAKLRMKHALRARGTEARADMPKEPMKPDMPKMTGDMKQMRSDMHNMSDDMLKKMDQMCADMQACVEE